MKIIRSIIIAGVVFLAVGIVLEVQLHMDVFWVTLTAAVIGIIAFFISLNKVPSGLLDIKISSKAGKLSNRLFRFWLIVCLPLAMYFGYVAYDSNARVAFFDEKAKYWREEAKKVERGERPIALIVPKEEWPLMLDLKYQAINNAEKSLIFCVTSFFLPFFIWVLITASRWIWMGRQPPPPP